jgi:predicted anti-sigma-YlaC factor YlaD
MTEHIQDRLDAYLEAMLDSGTHSAFDRHLAECGACRRAVKAAREARQCLDWLVPAEAPPVPGPEFYARVEQSIERRLARNWFDALGAAMRPRLAYPLLFLGLMAAAWTFTSDIREPEEGLTAIEYPSAEFAQMSFTTADHDQSEDLVMMNLVAMPEEQ